MSLSGRTHEHKNTEMEALSVERGSRRTVVAAVDESSLADDVFDFVCSYFNCPETVVVFTHVAKPVDSLFNSFAVVASEARAKGYLAEGWVKRAEDLKVDFKALSKVLVGDPREELFLFCDHLKPDALVMGSHGRKGLTKMMLGSVSDYCVRFCECSVIVVKPKMDEKRDESGYSSVFRLAAKSLGMRHLLKDKVKDNTAGALKEIDTKASEEGLKEPKLEDPAPMKGIKLEDPVPMDSSPFPPAAEPAAFPESDSPFPPPISAA